MKLLFFVGIQAFEHLCIFVVSKQLWRYTP